MPVVRVKGECNAWPPGWQKGSGGWPNFDRAGRKNTGPEKWPVLSRIPNDNGIYAVPGNSMIDRNCRHWDMRSIKLLVLSGLTI